jgi:hypothetical protein
LELAVTIYHELRHAEGDLLHTEQGARAIHNALDSYTRPSSDPREAAFQREVGLTR